MQLPMSGPMANCLQRMIADGSLSGQDLQAMLLGPTPVPLMAVRRQTAALDPATVDTANHP